MPKTLLLADDSLTIQKVVGICLANEDISIVSVDNGEDAVIKARALRPDIVIADVVMPRKNGYEVCLSIRQDPELKHVPVILLAGAFEAFDEKRYREVMANSYIIKPFESQTLIGAVKKLLYPEQAQVPAPQPLRPPTVTPVPGAAPPAAVRPPIVPPMAPPRMAAPEMPPAPPHVAPSAPPAAPRPTGTAPFAAPRPPSMSVPGPSAVPAAERPAAPVPSFEAALGPAVAAPPEIPRPPSAELHVADEISTEDIEEIATSGVMDAVPPEAPKVEGLVPISTEGPASWNGVDIRQAEPGPAAAPTVDEAPPAKPMGIEEWGLELKQELAEAAAPPQILTPAESAQEIPFVAERPAGAPQPIELSSPTVPAPAFVERPAPVPDQAPAPAVVEGPAPSLAERPVLSPVEGPVGSPVEGPAEVKAPPAQPVSPAELQEMVKKSIREIVERVAWEVVPELAETVIREEIKRLLAEEEKK
ncbi:MAG: response regulator [Deltaproteobacteria bacterium]|nr:response regulator [Deltaproteobacteria bacterium]